MGKRWGTQADSSTLFQWNGTSFNGLQTKVYTYNADNSIAEIKEYNAQTHEYLHRYTYKYDQQGRLVEILMEANYNGTLKPYMRYTYIFDAHGNQEVYKTESFSNNTWNISDGDSAAFTYDAMDRITEMSLFKYNGSNINPIQKLDYSDFNANNLPETVTIQTYQGSSYINYVQLQNTGWQAGYDPININPSSYIGYLWQQTSWQRATYDTAYVHNGRMDSSFLFQYTTNTLDSLNKTTFAYDSQDKLWETLNYYYSTNIWELSSGHRDSNAYGSYDELQYQISSTYSAMDFRWNIDGKEVFYYNSLSVQPVKRNTLNLYPNPAKNTVYIQLDQSVDEIVFINSQGMEIHPKWSSNQIHLEQIPPGIYLVRMKSDEAYYFSKIEVIP